MTAGFVVRSSAVLREIAELALRADDCPLVGEERMLPPYEYHCP